MINDADGVSDDDDGVDDDAVVGWRPILAVLQLKFKQRNSIVQPSSKYANKGHKYIIQMWKTTNFKISEEKTKAKVTSTKQILHHTKEYASNMQVKFGNEPNDGHRSVSQD